MIVVVLVAAGLVFCVAMLLLEYRADRKARKTRTAIELGPLARALNDTEREQRRREEARSRGKA